MINCEKLIEIIYTISDQGEIKNDLKSYVKKLKKY